MRRLALTDLNRENLSKTEGEIRAQYPDVEIETLQLDVADEQAVESTVSQAVKRFGRIDVGINFAGIVGTGKATHERDEVDWLRVVDINLNGVWRSQRAELRVMMKQEYVIGSCFKVDQTSSS